MQKCTKNAKKTKKNAKIFAHIKKKYYLCIEIKKQPNNQPRRQRVTSGKEVMKTTTENKTMKKINDNVIIATSREMNEAGLFKCTPDDRITLWHYEKHILMNKMQWMPILELHTEPLTEDIVNERGEVIEPKSTHKVDEFYGNLVWGEMDLRNYMMKIGVSIKPIEC